MIGNVEDRLEIIELSSAYSGAASRLDIEGMKAVYTEDAIVTGIAEAVGLTGDLVGRTVIGDFFKPIFDHLESLQQMPAVVAVAVDGDKATATTQIIEYVTGKGSASMTIIVGVYADKLVRTAQGWRFNRRDLTVKRRMELA